jgi:uncharacterized RmlC-like cupin family protein
MRELLLQFIDRNRTFKDCRRAANLSNLDLRALAFREAFQRLIDLGFIQECTPGNFALTSAGAQAIDQNDPQSNESGPSIQLGHPEKSLAFVQQGLEREIIFGANANSPLCLERITLHPGDESIPHSCAGAATAYYTLSGTVWLHHGRLLQEWVEIGPNDCYFVPAGVIHCVVNNGDRDMQAIVARSSANHRILEYPSLLDQLSGMQFASIAS